MLQDPQTLLIILPILLLSIVIHEVAHGYAALFQGDPTAKNAGRLTLNPLVHIDPFWTVIVPAMTLFAGGFLFGMAKPVPYNPANFTNRRWGEALVALAGPVVNIIIAGVFVVLIHVTYAWQIVSDAVLQGMALIVIINLFLAVFNMIPIPPLDGSKVFFAFLSPAQRHIRVWMEQYALILCIILLAVLFSTNILGTTVYFLMSTLL